MLVAALVLGVLPLATPANAVSATAVSAGKLHSCAVTTVGVMCWGNNQYGQLGNGTTNDSWIPVGVVGLSSGVVAVSAGGKHTCALTTGGGVVCWGDNSRGELGNNSLTNSSTPVNVVGLSSGVTEISAGGKHVCALTTAGGVKCWGANPFGQVGNGTFKKSLVPVDVVGLTSGVTEISAGGKHTCAVLASGGVDCWGYDRYGQLGNGGTINKSKPVPVKGLSSPAIGVSAGGRHTCATLSSGLLKCWGWDGFGQLGDTTKSRLTVAQESAGGAFTCARTTAGGAKCWGNNKYGQLGNRSTATTSGAQSVIGLSTGTLALSAGGKHACALITGGVVKCWGFNKYGQLGNGKTTNRSTPGIVSFNATLLSPVTGTGTYGSDATLSAKLSSAGGPIGGATISFTLNGTNVGVATTDASGVATLSGVSLSGLNAGAYPNAVFAAFAGDSNYQNTSKLGDLTVAKADQTISLSGIPGTAPYNSTFIPIATSTAGLPVSVSVSGGCSLDAGQATITSASNDCSVTASQAGNSNYNAATVSRTVTVEKANQTITFPPLLDRVYGDADTALAATASSGLTVSYSASGNCTIASGNAHITGAGSCTVTASQAGDADYNPAPDTDQSFAIAKASQSISFGSIDDSTFGNPDFEISATASSGLDVSLSAASGPCSLDSSTSPANVHIGGAGLCSITATQAGDSNYEAAPDVTRSFDVSKANQTITFGALPDRMYGDADFGVSASASSGLDVTFTTTGNCTVSSSTVHITGAGSCGVTASQAGDDNYNPAADVTQTFSIAKANQTITFGALPDATYGDPDFGLGATASSGLAVSYSASGNCTVAAATLHITGAGSCSVTASQPGDGNYNAASPVTQSFSIAKAGQTISFGPLSNKTFGDPDFVVSATSSSGLAVSFTSTGKCTVAGNTVHITGAGSCSVKASQGGNANYNAAPDVTQSFSIAKADQSITFGAIDDSTFGDPDFAISATATSGLAVALAVASGPCTIDSPTSPANVHISGTGMCAITASQGGNANYNPAPNVSRTFSISRANQSITFTPLPNRTYGDPDFSVSATASSGLAVSFAATGNCTISGTIVHIVSAGSCTITASQTGDGNFNPAPDVSQSFTIAKKGLIISANNQSKLFGDPFSFAGTEFTTTGLVSGDTVASVTLISGGRPAAAAIGAYDITPSAAVGTGLDNYTITYQAGTLKVYLRGLVGLNSVMVGNNGSLVDSFDSSQGPYTTGGATSVSRIFSNGTITLATGSTVYGDVRSTQGNVILHASSGGDPGAVVNGNVTAGTTVSQKGTVTGTTSPGSPASAIVAPLPSACSPFSPNAGISGSYTYSASTGDLVVGTGGTATLSNGSYCLHSITVSNSSTLRVNGPVVVNLTGKLSVAAGSFLNNTTSVPADLRISTSYTGTDTGVSLAGGGSSQYLSVYAPGTNVVVSSGSTFLGSVLGLTVMFSGNSTALHDDTQLLTVWASFFGL